MSVDYLCARMLHLVFQDMPERGTLDGNVARLRKDVVRLVGKRDLRVFEV